MKTAHETGTISKAAVALRAWLSAHGKSQTWLAEKLDVAQVTISHWLLGRNVPRTGQTHAIQRVTKIPSLWWTESGAPTKAEIKAAGLVLEAA